MDPIHSAQERSRATIYNVATITFYITAHPATGISRTWISTTTARKVKRKVYFVVVEKSGTPAAHSALYSMNISIPNLSRNCFLYDHQPWLYTEIVPTMDPNSAREWQYPNIRIFYRDFSIFLPRTISSLFIHIKESITAVHQHQAPGHRPSSSQKISLKCSL